MSSISPKRISCTMLGIWAFGKTNLRVFSVYSKLLAYFCV